MSSRFRYLLRYLPAYLLVMDAQGCGRMIAGQLGETDIAHKIAHRAKFGVLAHAL